MERKTKMIKVSLPIDTWEEFYRCFPGKNERADVIRQLVSVLVELVDEKDCFKRQIREALLDKFGEDEPWA